MSATESSSEHQEFKCWEKSVYIRYIFKPTIKSPQIPMVTFLSVTYATEIGGKDKHENCKSSTILHWSMYIFKNFLFIIKIYSILYV